MCSSDLGIGDIEALCEGVGLPNTAGLSYPGWMYLVNGVQPDVGFAQYTLNDGDQVEFKYGVYTAFDSQWNAFNRDWELLVEYDRLTTLLTSNKDSEKVLQWGSYKNSNGNIVSLNHDFAGIWIYHFGTRCHKIRKVT